MTMTLWDRSIDIILENQSSSGAYLASPNFPTYHYSWFRDGAFIAYAMDIAGHHESAARFHEWAAT
ncbi:MAG: glycoside hydrolase, partial [Chloroflexota bacterium]